MRLKVDNEITQQMLTSFMNEWGNGWLKSLKTRRSHQKFTKKFTKTNEFFCTAFETNDRKELLKKFRKIGKI